MIVDGKFKPTEDTGIEFYLKKNDTVQRQVAECKAGVEYTVILRRTGTTIDIYFKYFGEFTKTIRESIFKEKKTTTQEIDEDKLEDEYDIEEEIIPEEELGEGEVEEENAEGGEGNISEKDREREREREKEEGQEQEEESEKEKEGEKEE